MSRSVIDDYILKVYVGIQSEAGNINAADVRGIVSRLAADVRAPSDVGMVSFLELEDIPQDRRSQFFAAIDAVVQKAQ